MENKLTVDRAKAIEAYQLATPDQQRVLESIFGRDALQMSWQEDLKRACKDLKLNYEFELPYGLPSNKDEEVLNAYAALRILAKWVRGDWKPDWNNPDEAKHTPFFTAYGGVRAVCTDTCYHSPAIGALYFPKSSMAINFGRKYIDLYKIILTN